MDNRILIFNRYNMMQRGAIQYKQHFHILLNGLLPKNITGRYTKA